MNFAKIHTICSFSATNLKARSVSCQSCLMYNVYWRTVLKENYEKDGRKIIELYPKKDEI